MRRAAMLSLVALAGCASGGSPGSGSSAPQTLHVEGLGSLSIRPTDGARVTALPFSADRVWSVLPAVYDALGIPITELDQGKKFIGNSGMRVHKHLNKTPLTTFLDCGNAQGFPSAETYDISMSVATQVEAAKDGGALIGTLVQATGRPMAFAGATVKCTSKAELEMAIANAVKGKLQP